MILRVGLEIRIPLRLLAEDDFAINHRRRLAIAAAEIEADATTFQIAAQRIRPCAFCGDVAGANDFDRMIIHPFADDLGIKFPGGVIAIMRGQPGRKISRAIEMNPPTAARPEQEL